MTDGAEPGKIVCSWCGHVIQDGDEPVSHGMCKACRSYFERPYTDPKEEPDEEVS